MSLIYLHVFDRDHTIETVAFVCLYAAKTTHGFMALIKWLIMLTHFLPSENPAPILITCCLPGAD